MTKTLVLVICLFAASKSHAWGSLGHWTMARIADAGLTPETQSIVSEILDGQPLAHVSTRPDSWRYQKSWRFTGNYHFDTVPADSDFLSALKKQSPKDQAKGGIVLALLRSIEVLRQAKYTGINSEVRNALIFLVHFVGDIHQPLHVGRPGDRGGNTVRVFWNGKRTNLHTLWDSQLITSAHHEMIDGNEVLENSKIYAAYLWQQFSSSPTEDMTGAFNEDEIAGWIQEQMGLRESLYSGLDDEQSTYTNLFAHYADQRLFISGRRLAWILNSVFSENEDPISSKLKKEVVSLIGKIENIIRFAPNAR